MQVSELSATVRYLKANNNASNAPFLAEAEAKLAVASAQLKATKPYEARLMAATQKVRGLVGKVEEAKTAMDAKKHEAKVAEDLYEATVQVKSEADDELQSLIDERAALEMSDTEEPPASEVHGMMTRMLTLMGTFAETLSATSLANQDSSNAALASEICLGVKEFHQELSEKFPDPGLNRPPKPPPVMVFARSGGDLQEAPPSATGAAGSSAAALPRASSVGASPVGTSPLVSTGRANSRSPPPLRGSLAAKQ